MGHAIGHRDRAETTHEQPRGSRSASWNTSFSGDPEHNLRKSSATRPHSSPMIRLSVRPRTSWREDTMTCPLRACGNGLRRIMVALIFAAWCSPAAAQQPAAPPQMNMADHRGAVRGVVRNDAGAPVAGRDGDRRQRGERRAVHSDDRRARCLLVRGACRSASTTSRFNRPGSLRSVARASRR